MKDQTPIVEPVSTPEGPRYPCPECETLHSFASTAILCSLTHEED